MTNAAAMAAPAPPSELHARDSIIAWFRGEFAAANAIIDDLCGHLADATAEPGQYDAVFAAVHRRRTNWIPVLHMQRFYSIADVTAELERVSAERSLPPPPPPPAPAPECENEILCSIPSVNEENHARGIELDDQENENSLSDASDRKAGDGDGGILFDYYYQYTDLLKFVCYDWILYEGSDSCGKIPS